MDEDFAAKHYGGRARAYVASTVHAQGPDLDQIETALRAQKFAAVLDLGCGGGHVSYRAAPHVGEVVACDVTPSMLEAVAQEARRRGLKNIRAMEGAAEALPFADEEFDAVLCRFSAHHWRDFWAGLVEARRVLKPGGLAIFIDSVGPGQAVLDTHLQAVELLRDPSHVRNYSAPEWGCGLERAGFVVAQTVRRRLRIEFSSWIARTATSAAHAAAIRSLQDTAAPPVRDYFGIDADGNFDLDAVTFTANA